MASPGFDATPRPQEVKHALHKEVFLPNGERLVGFMKVCKYFNFYMQHLLKYADVSICYYAKFQF